jgi:hypothetical protein
MRVYPLWTPWNSPGGFHGAIPGGIYSVLTILGKIKFAIPKN